MQDVVSRGDWLLGKPGVPGTKSPLQRFFGYGNYVRRSEGWRCRDGKFGGEDEGDEGDDRY